MEKQKLQFKSSISLAKENNRVKDVAKKLGMVLPSTHTALFQSVFAKLEEANLNGVRLGKEVGASVNQMIGAQANLEHKGYSFIVGIILDAWLDEATQEINIVYSFAKNIYKEEYTQALEKMHDKDLSVSFELLAEHADISHLKDDTILVSKVDWQGVGVLIEADPAYAKAETYAVASIYKERAEQILDKEFIMANRIVKQCQEILSEQNKVSEGEKVMNEQEKKLVVDLRAELGDFAKELKDEELLDEKKVADVRKIKEEAMKRTIEETKKTEVVSDEVTQTTTTEATCVETIDWSEEYKIMEQAKKDADVKIAELEATIKSKDEEALSQKKELDVFKAEKATKEATEKKAKLEAIKAELKDNQYAKEFKDEDYLDEKKVNDAKLKKENDDLKAENAQLKSTVKIEASAPEQPAKEIQTGHKTEVVEEKKENPRAIIAQIGKNKK